MMSKLNPVKHQQQEGVSLQVFALSAGFTVDQVRKYCQAGRITGARKHPLSGHWFIYPPAKLLTGRLL